MIKLHEQNQFGNLPKPQNVPSNENHYQKAEAVQPKQAVVPSESLTKVTGSPQHVKPLNKWHQNSPITKVAAAEQSSSEFEFDENVLSNPILHKKSSETDVKKPSIENILKDFGIKPAQEKRSDHKIEESGRPSPKQKPSPLSTYKDLLDEEDLESLLGKESPSKSRLPNSRTKLTSREKDGVGLTTKRSHGLLNKNRFSPERRHGVLPAMGVVGHRPFRDDGLSKLHHHRIGMAEDFNSNNNALVNENIFAASNKDVHRKPLANHKDTFWANLFSDDANKKHGSSTILPDIGNTQPFQNTKQVG